MQICFSAVTYVLVLTDGQLIMLSVMGPSFFLSAMCVWQVALLEKNVLFSQLQLLLS